MTAPRPRPGRAPEPPDPGSGVPGQPAPDSLAERLAYSVDEAARLTGLFRDLLYDEQPTVGQLRPELPLIVALADALGAELRVVPRAVEPHGQRASRAAGGVSRLLGLALADYGRLHAPRERGLRRATRPSGTVTCSCRGRSIYYLASDGTVPALEFLDACPGAIDAQFTAVLGAVVAASPPRFSGGANGRPCRVMGGWYEGSG